MFLYVFFRCYKVRSSFYSTVCDHLLFCLLCSLQLQVDYKPIRKNFQFSMEKEVFVAKFPRNIFEEAKLITLKVSEICVFSLALVPVHLSDFYTRYEFFRSSDSASFFLQWSFWCFIVNPKTVKLRDFPWTFFSTSLVVFLETNTAQGHEKKAHFSKSPWRYDFGNFNVNDSTMRISIMYDLHYNS